MKKLCWLAFFIISAKIGKAQTVTLPGVGSKYVVNLTWDAPTVSVDPVNGYAIFRTPSGTSSYQQIGTVLAASLTYKDSAIPGTSQAYDYIVESTDNSGNYSAPSNTATVTIPVPLPSEPSNLIL